MKDHARLIERVAGHNPVPNHDDPPIGAWDLNIVRAQVTERDIPMLTEERQIETPNPVVSQRRGWQVALASFAIVLLAGGGLWLTSRGGSPDIASPSPTTNAPSNDLERIAVDAMFALFTFDEEALLATASTQSTEGALWSLRFDQALNTRAESITCSQSETANSVANCRVVFQSDLQDNLGIGPNVDLWNVTVIDGGWAFIAHQFTENPTQREGEWATIGLPNRHPGLYDEGGACEGFRSGGPTPVACAELLLLDSANAPDTEAPPTTNAQQSTTTTAPQSTTTTAPLPTADQVAMVQQMVDARNAHDYDALLALIAEDATIALPQVMNNGEDGTAAFPTLTPTTREFELGKLQDSMAFEAVLNAEWTMGQCRIPAGSIESIVCELTYTDDFSNAIGEVWGYEVVAEGTSGAVQHYQVNVSTTFAPDRSNSASKIRGAWIDFLQWLDQRSPEDARVAGRQESNRLDEPGEGWLPLWDEAAALIVAQYLDAYAAATS